jgi:hypothetical protein
VTLVHYDRKGNPISMEGWMHLVGQAEYKRVASTVIPESDVWVSTVWLGIDHGFHFLDERHAPLIFETMVFGGKDEIMDRYSTEDEAREGHVRVVLSLLPPGVRMDPAKIPLDDPPS